MTPVTQADADAARERLATLGEIAAEVAHELRNVLQVISTSAYVARLDPGASTPHIVTIERNARLGQSIVNDLMALAKGGALDVDVAELTVLIEAGRFGIEPGAATWVDAVTPSGLSARVHPGLAARLLHALYENAIAVSAPRRPAITTRALRDGGVVVVDVTDDGPGVPREIAAHIFDPLVTGRPGGTGLGLALARRIATANGGTLVLVEGASDEGPQAGATFRATFPAADA